MNRREKAVKIQKILDELYPDPAIPLTYQDPYTLLLAVLLSAQSTDARVNTITPLLFSKAATPQEMVRLSIDQIEQIIRPCGLGRTKAAAIWKLSEMLIEQFNSTVPHTFDELESLPGVGHKTASVVLAQAFGIPAFPVDTHIHRNAKRWGLSKETHVRQTEEDLKKIFNKESWNKLHLQMILFAREYCPARGHLAEKCPICSVICKGDRK